MLELYLKGYPDGAYSREARARLAAIPAIDKLRHPSPSDYLAIAGKGAKLVPPGELDVDGFKPMCGKFPTILDPGLDDHQASFHGFIILNPRRFARETSTVKLWIYSMGCGFQFRGPHVATADCFAVQRGHRQGWLTEKGMDEVCAFISRAEEDAMHQSGPARCSRMRQCFADMASK